MSVKTYVLKAASDARNLEIARAAYFAAGGTADDERRAQKVSRIQVAIQDGKDGVLAMPSPAPSNGDH